MVRSAVSIKDYKNLTTEDFEAAVDIKITEKPVLYEDTEGLIQVHGTRKILFANDTPCSVVSNQFQYVQPKEHILSTLSTLNDNGVEYVPKQLHVMRNGAHIMAVLDLPQFKMFQGSDEEQIMQMFYQFGYDGMNVDKGELGFLRWMCTNGMVSMDKQMSYRMHHRGDVETKAKDVINLYKDLDGTFKANEERILQMSNTNANKDKVAMYIGNGEMTSQEIFTGERWAGKLNEEWKRLQEPVNLWVLYNMFTYFISHQYGSNHGSKVTMMNKLNRAASKWNTTLQ